MWLWAQRQQRDPELIPVTSLFVLPQDDQPPRVQKGLLPKPTGRSPGEQLLWTVTVLVMRIQTHLRGGGPTPQLLGAASVGENAAT